MVFFGSSLQIFATLIPASINGIGLRETAAVALYTAVGVAGAQAVLIPIVGFTAEMLVSACGGLVFMLRGSDYKASLQVDDAEREQAVYEAIGEVEESDMPRLVRGGLVGLSAGLLGGALVGLAEACVIVLSGEGPQALLVLAYGPVLYGLFCGAGGCAGGVFVAWTGRLMKRAALLEPDAFGRYLGLVVAFFGLALGAFRIRRDLFHEELVWKSVQGLGVLAGVGACAAVLCIALAWGAPRILRSGPISRWLLAVEGTRLRPTILLLPLVLVAGLGLVGAVTPVEPGDGGPADRVAAPEQAGPVLFIVIDTLRADALPGYGAEGLETPHLDAFAEDAIRFDQAFVNSSWTRPSFASLMTGRYPRNHGVMSKADRLPEEITTIGEAFSEGGFQTGGFVTNFNVAPFFGFHQGFDFYQYMEPNFPLGADDASAKLLLHQFLRQRIEKWRASRGQVEPGGAYQDAETVNRALGQWLDTTPDSPWFLFVGYMDPHDPYFEHPYTGNGYSRAANQHPDPSEAPELRRLYRAEIEYWDEQFGELVADLQRRGLYDDLTIVITSDHGEEFCDHGGFWHGTTLYDEQLRVPLYLKLPAGRRAGTTVRHWVQSIDIMPTLLAESGLPVPEGIQGRSLFEGSSEVYAWENHEGNDLESVRRREGTDEVKLITANPGNPRGLNPVELYRVDFDPGETENVAADQPDEVESTMEALIAAREAAAEGAVEATTVGLEGDAADRLRALGYISDEE
jgi:arylsulfatase A-like enzyme